MPRVAASGQASCLELLTIDEGFLVAATELRKQEPIATPAFLLQRDEGLRALEASALLLDEVMLVPLWPARPASGAANEPRHEI